MGDAYLAAGGLPVPDYAAAKNTVLAALDMQRFISQRKAEKEKKGEIAFDMRVGIETGPIVAGIVGTKKFQYDIWGDTVNTASRLETLGEIRKVNISRRTYEAIKDDKDISFERRGNVAVKGKGEMEMWYVFRKTEDTTSNGYGAKFTDIVTEKHLTAFQDEPTVSSAD
jgi:class 3 adenylate cyclase